MGQSQGMEPRITAVTLGYANFDRARSFYASMGWAGSSPDGEVVFVQAGGMVLALWDRKLLAADSAVTEDPGGWGGVTLAHNVASPEEVDDVLAEAEAAGGRIGRPGADTEWGGYSGLFLDPDGHRWEVAHNPAWPLAADGTVTLPSAE